MSGITIIVTTVLSLLGLGIAFYFMRKVTSVPVDMGLDEKEASASDSSMVQSLMGRWPFLSRNISFS